MGIKTFKWTTRVEDTNKIKPFGATKKFGHESWSKRNENNCRKWKQRPSCAYSFTRLSLTNTHTQNSGSNGTSSMLACSPQWVEVTHGFYYWSPIQYLNGYAGLTWHIKYVWPYIRFHACNSRKRQEKTYSCLTFKPNVLYKYIFRLSSSLLSLLLFSLLSVLEGWFFFGAIASNHFSCACPLVKFFTSFWPDSSHRIGQYIEWKNSKNHPYL